MNIITGTRDYPVRMVVYGGPGVGKSTFASQMPKPIVVDFDGGLEQLGCDRVTPPLGWTQTLELLKELVASEYKTLVIDTADGLEDLATEHVCNKSKKQTLAQFGWGEGYEALAGEWRVLLSTLEDARRNDMAVVLLSHAIVKTVNDPTVGAFDMCSPNLQKKTWAVTHRWADVVGFAAFDSALLKDERRALLTGDRVLRTTKGSGFEAKNRYGLPQALPLRWSALRDVMPSDVRARIRSIAGEHAEKAEAFVAEAGNDAVKLLEIERVLREKVKG